MHAAGPAWSVPADVPALHSEHPVAAAYEYVPSEHTTHDDSAPAYRPALHVAHSVWSLAAAPLETDPAAQASQVPKPELANRPEEHTVQVPAALVASPAEHPWQVAPSVPNPDAQDCARTLWLR